LECDNVWRVWTSWLPGTLQFNDALKLLGVTLVALLSFDKQVTNVVPACTFHTCALQHIRPLLTLEVAKEVAVSIVWNRLDCCYSLLNGRTEWNFDRLQRVPNTLARIVFLASAPDLLRELHWLPIQQCVRFKLVAVTFEAKLSTSVWRLTCMMTYMTINMTINLPECSSLPLHICFNNHCCFSCLHRRCSYCMELTVCKHSICSQLC